MTDEIDAEIERLEGRLTAHACAAAETLALALEKPLVAGSTGQLTANGLFRVSEREERLALEIAGQLTALRRDRRNAAELEPFAAFDRAE